jgi:hypothetical protein
MIAKTVEIRDRATFIPALAIRLDPVTEQDRYLLGRAGYGITREKQGEYIVLLRLAGGTGQATCDPYDWDTRTMLGAHRWLLPECVRLEGGRGSRWSLRAARGLGILGPGLANGSHGCGVTSRWTARRRGR